MGAPLADLAEQPVARGAIPYLEERRLEAIELRNEAELALGRHDGLLPELEQLIAAIRIRERLREQQMLALYRSGRQKEALDAYREARRTFVEDLGIDRARRCRRSSGRCSGTTIARRARLRAGRP